MSKDRPEFLQLVKLLKAQLHGLSSEMLIQHLLIDSRNFRGQQGVLFFALEGDVHDGHDFIEELYNKGIRHFVVEEIPQKAFPDASFAEVENSLSALQKVAADHRKKFSYPVVGITGSNGKTIIKEWAHQLLLADKHIVRSPKSYNSQVGVPLSLWGMESKHELALIEAGISRPSEMEKLERMIQPNIGIMSNIGSAHQEHFSSYAAKVRSKMLLFRNCETLIYCRDHPLIHKRAQKLKDTKLINWSLEGEAASVQVVQIKHASGYTHLKVQSDRGVTSFRIPFVDSASVENAMHLFCLLELFGIGKQTIQKRMSSLQTVDMRLELKKGLQQSLLINDSYNSDIESFRIALDVMKAHRKRQKAVVILSDMVENDSEKWVGASAELLREMEVEQFIGIGPILHSHADQFPVNSHFYTDTSSFLQHLSDIDWNKRVVLLKGSRKFAFERILARLEQQHHQTILRINMNALSENLSNVRASVPEGVKLMAVVKAFSYGAGSSEVASLLQYHKVDYLAVAYADEGLALRQAGIQLPIMVMNPEPDSLEAMIENQLEPEIYNFRSLQLFLQGLNRLNYSGEKHKIHLKLDSGMHRLGFDMEQLPTLINLLKQQQEVEVASIMSHLAASDDPQMSRETLMQIERFKMMSDQLMSSLNSTPLRHILNSSGIHNYPEASFDMVRLGIGIHGVQSDSALPVASLFTHISQIKMLRKGQGLGYGFSFIAPQDMKIATIAIGYADGFNRLLSNGVGEVFIAGKRAKVVGKVCMDLTMVDVSQIACEEGDEVEIFGKNIRVREIAEKLNTIPYEVLTSVSQRVKRIYTQE